MFNIAAKGKRFYLVIHLFALMAISCGDSEGSPDRIPVDNLTCNPNETVIIDDGTPVISVSLSDALSQACSNDQLDGLAANLFWDIQTTGVSVRCVYITPSGDGSNNGSDWDNAYSVEKLRDLSTDTDISPSDTQVYLYLLKSGTYKPSDKNVSVSDADRKISFSMRDYVAIIGGFSGIGFDRFGNTILSGDIGVMDETPDNSYHVLYNDGLTSAALLAHVTVSGGNADHRSSQEFYLGGGMHNNYSSPTITESIFSNNSAKIDGGGIYNYFSSPSITASTFSNNTALRGGGLYNIGRFTRITASTFSGNSASSGGGLFQSSSHFIRITSSTFSGNTASDEGGAIYNFNSQMSIDASTFIENSANSNGGAISTDDRIVLFNSLLWGNTAGGFANQINLVDRINGGKLIVGYSLLQGGTAGVADTSSAGKIFFSENIISSDPNRGDLANYGGSVETYSIPVSSPAVNQGILTGWNGNYLCYREASGCWRHAYHLSSTAAFYCSEVDPVTTDARGYTHNGLPDIGAYEVNGTPPPNP